MHLTLKCQPTESEAKPTVDLIQGSFLCLVALSKDQRLLSRSRHRAWKVAGIIHLLWISCLQLRAERQPLLTSGSPGKALSRGDPCRTRRQEATKTAALRRTEEGPRRRSRPKTKWAPPRSCRGEVLGGGHPPDATRRFASGESKVLSRIPVAAWPKTPGLKWELRTVSATFPNPHPRCMQRKHVRSSKRVACCRLVRGMWSSLPTGSLHDCTRRITCPLRCTRLDLQQSTLYFCSLQQQRRLDYARTHKTFKQHAVRVGLWMAGRSPLAGRPRVARNLPQE